MEERGILLFDEECQFSPGLGKLSLGHELLWGGLGSGILGNR